MKTLTIASFKLKELLKSKSAWFTILILPVFFIFVAGGIYSPDITDQTIPIAIVDEDLSEFSRFLIELIKEEKLLEVIETELSHGLKLVKAHQVEGTYIIKGGFQDLIKKDLYPQLEVIKSSNSYGADAISEIIASGLVRLQSNARAANLIVREYEKQRTLTDQEKESLWEEVFNHSESYWVPEQLMQLDYQALYFNQETWEKNSIIGFSEGPFGVVLTFLALSGIFGLASIAKERESDTFKRLYLITNSTKALMMGNIMPLLLILSLQAYLLFSILIKFFGIYEGVSFLYLGLTLLGYILLISCGVVFLSSFSKKGVDLQNKYGILVLLSSIIGGSFWSVELMPSILRFMAILTPQGIGIEMFKMARLGNGRQVVIYFFIIVSASGLLLFLSEKRIRAFVK